MTILCVLNFLPPCRHPLSPLSPGFYFSPPKQRSTGKWRQGNVPFSDALYNALLSSNKRGTFPWKSKHPNGPLKVLKLIDVEIGFQKKCHKLKL